MANDKVGYGRPPKANQFKAGQSGNPRGRPKAVSLGFEALMQAFLHEAMRDRSGGRDTSASRLEWAIRGLFQKALQGDIAATRQLAKLRKMRTGKAVQELLVVTDWLPDVAGETAAQKNALLGVRAVAGAIDEPGGAGHVAPGEAAHATAKDGWNQ